MNGAAVFRLAFSHLASEEDAREVCQEVFVRAMGHLQKVGVKDANRMNFRAWLRIITRNMVYDRFRRSAAAPPRAGADALGNLAVEMCPDSRAINEERLKILSEPSRPEDGDDLAKQLTAAIVSAIPDGEVTVQALSPGHFEIDVVSPVFEGKSRVKQQQLVYAAITPLMAGDDAPVHAIDRLTTRTPAS